MKKGFVMSAHPQSGIVPISLLVMEKKKKILLLCFGWYQPSKYLCGYLKTMGLNEFIHQQQLYHLYQGVVAAQAERH